MADQPAGEKTEQPTEERLRRARREGQLPQSKEVPSALMLGMLVIVLSLSAGMLHRFFVSGMQVGLSCDGAGAMDSDSFTGRLRSAGLEALLAVSPFLIAGAAVSIFASVIVAGWTFSPKAVGFKPDRINPIHGLKNLLSLKSLVQLLVSIAKLIVVGVIVYEFIRGEMQTFMQLVWATPTWMLATISRMALGVMFRITIALMAIALIDWLYQRWQWRRKLRMTRQEVKEERKQYELSPELRGRIRSVQIALASRRMLQDVPTADVVLANPTHVAVALRYETGEMDSPIVVAKGPELLCEKIKEIARHHGVPVLHRPELARALFSGVDVGEPIPETLFVAVAEVLALVYRLRNRHAGASGTNTNA